MIPIKIKHFHLVNGLITAIGLRRSIEASPLISLEDILYRAVGDDE